MKRYFSVVSKDGNGGGGGASASSASGASPSKRPWPGGTGDAGTCTAGGGGGGAAAAAPAGTAMPLRFMSWNCNGLLQRLARPQDWEAFKQLVARERPDVVGMQEVRLPAAKSGAVGRRTRMDQGNMKEYNLVYSTVMKMGYQVALSLADMKKAGTLLMVRQELAGQVQSITFNLPGLSPAHEEEGRVILMEFPSFGVLNTYVPNHGWSRESFERRARWDAQVLAFLEAREWPLVWLGDLNVSHLDFDVSHPSFFSSQKPKPPTPLPANPDYRGQPGYAPIERRRFGRMLEAGRLVDAYRALHPQMGADDWTWRGVQMDGARYAGKGMRIDYTCVSRSLLAPPHGLRIARAEVLGHGVERHKFCGSDHCPIVLELELPEEAAPTAAAAATAPAASGNGDGKTAVAAGNGDGEEQEDEGAAEDAKPGPAATVVVDLSEDD